MDPDGRALQQAGERETILTEILDLDNVRKAREFGTLGLCQLWKQLRDRPVQFPIYANGIETGEIYRDLGGFSPNGGWSWMGGNRLSLLKQPLHQA